MIITGKILKMLRKLIRLFIHLYFIIIINKLLTILFKANKSSKFNIKFLKISN